MSDQNNQTSTESFDSDKEHLASVYAKSLLGAAAKAGNTESVVGQLESYVHDVLAKLPKLNDALCSFRLSGDEKAALIDKSTAGAEGELVRFLKVVCQHGRADCLKEISAAARRMFNEQSGRVEAVVVTAVEVTDSMRDDIQHGVNVMLSKEAHLRFEVDPSIIGGLVVRVGDTVYDGSVATQLEAARQKVAAKAAQEIRGSNARFAVEI